MSLTIDVVTIKGAPLGAYEIVFDVEREQETESVPFFSGFINSRCDDGIDYCEFVRFSAWTNEEGTGKKFRITRRGQSGIPGTPYSLSRVQHPITDRSSKYPQESEQLGKVFRLADAIKPKGDTSSDYKEAMRKAQEQNSKQFQALYRKLGEIHKDVLRIAQLIEQLPVQIDRIVDEAFRQEVLSQIDARVGNLAHIWAAVPDSGPVSADLIAPIQDAGAELAYLFGRCREYGAAVYMAAGSSLIAALACYKVIARSQPIYLPIIESIQKSGKAYFEPLIDASNPASFRSTFIIQSQILAIQKPIADNFICNTPFLVAHHRLAAGGGGGYPRYTVTFKAYIGELRSDGYTFISAGPLQAPWDWEMAQVDHGLRRQPNWEHIPNYSPPDAYWPPNYPPMPSGAVFHVAYVERFYGEMIAAFQTCLALTKSSQFLTQSCETHVSNIEETLLAI